MAHREHDRESGLVHMRARQYDPRLGRFTQTDPMSGNRPTKHHTYGGNNPLSKMDPTGLYEVDAQTLKDYPQIVNLMRAASKDIMSDKGKAAMDKVVNAKPALLKTATTDGTGPKLRIGDTKDARGQTAGDTITLSKDLFEKALKDSHMHERLEATLFHETAHWLSDQDPDPAKKKQIRDVDDYWDQGRLAEFEYWKKIKLPKEDYDERMKAIDEKKLSAAETAREKARHVLTTGKPVVPWTEKHDYQATPTEK